ncbi:MAG: hypothetical protein ACE5E9_13840 [Nitrospinaceae bacterium]
MDGEPLPDALPPFSPPATLKGEKYAIPVEFGTHFTGLSGNYNAPAAENLGGQMYKRYMAIRV